MILQEEYNLNLESQLSKKYVKVSQYDTGRRLLITLLKNDCSMFKIPSEASASINGLKPDGKGFRYDCSIENNKVVVDMKEQMTVLAGYVKCEILLSKGGERIATANFMLSVEESPLSENTLISSTDIPLLQKAIEASEIVLSVEKTVKGYSESASKSSQSAQKSAESASSASASSAESARNSSQSAQASAESANNASQSATNAQESAESASNSAREAKTSAESAIQTKAEVEQLKKETVEQTKTLTDSAKQEISTVKDATVSEVTQFKNDTISDITIIKEGIVEEVTVIKNDAKAEADKAKESEKNAKQSETNASNSAKEAKASAESVANVVTDVSKLKEDTAVLQKRQNVLAGSETGNPISCDEAFSAPLCGLHIYGKSTQDGTPTTDSPVPIVSVGDGGSVVVKVSDGNGNEQTLTLQTPTGLPGIRVASGGNYTDPHGQQWVCDEVDLGRGVKVQRIAKAEIEQVHISIDPNWYDANKSYSYEIGVFTFVFSDDDTIQVKEMCNRFIMRRFNEFYNKSIETGGLAGHSYAVFNISKALGICTTVEEFKAWFNENVVLYKVLATPIETQLTSAEISAYKALITYAPNTVVYASDNAGIKLCYQRDVNLVIKNLEDAIASITTA